MKRINSLLAITVTLAISAACSIPAYSQAADAKKDLLPVAEQNAVVGTYCAVCHDDLHRNGGLSLQRFDGATVEPSLASMMVSKLRMGAIGASGQHPDEITETALLNALISKSSGAANWVLTKIQHADVNLLSASIVREGPATQEMYSATGELYRLTITCNLGTHETQLQLSWSPDPGKSGREVLVAGDGMAETKYLVGAGERMGNGAKKADGSDNMSPGAAAMVLYRSSPTNGEPNLPTPLPERSLTLMNLFPNSTVMFPFNDMPRSTRDALLACWSNR